MSTRASGSQSSIPIALAAVFAGIAVLATMLAVAYRTPVPLAIAAPFGLSASLVWYHATGRLHRRLRRGAVPGGRTRTGRGQAGDRRARDFHAGRADGRGAGSGAGRARAEGRRPGGAAGGHNGQPRDHGPPTRAEAYRTLDLEPGADADAVRAAYRRKVKEVHPDRGGDEAAFRDVTEAYDRLTGDADG